MLKVRVFKFSILYVACVIERWSSHMYVLTWKLEQFMSEMQFFSLIAIGNH